jgi:hypothetical protein
MLRGQVIHRGSGATMQQDNIRGLLAI